MPKPFDDDSLARLVGAAESGEFSGLTEAERQAAQEFRAMDRALRLPHTDASPSLITKLEGIFVPATKRSWLAVLLPPPAARYAVRGESQPLLEFECEVATVRLTVLPGPGDQGTVMGRIEPGDWQVTYQGQAVSVTEGEFELVARNFAVEGLVLVRGTEEVRLDPPGA